MRQFARKIFLTLAVFCGLFFILTIPTSTDGVRDNSSALYGAEQVKLNPFEEQARLATVKILVGMNGHGTGTLFKYGDKTLVFTAAHVTSFGKNYLYLVKNIYGEKKTGKLIYIDKKLDFAVLLVDDFDTVKPLPFKKKKFNPKNLIDLEVFFCSYPAQHSVLTSRGRVAGFEEEFLLINSVAWKGSSGASIFTRNGEFIGILFAISIDKPFGVPSLIDNIIWISPYYYIDWSELDEAIEKLDEKKEKKK